MTLKKLSILLVASILLAGCADDPETETDDAPSSATVAEQSGTDTTSIATTGTNPLDPRNNPDPRAIEEGRHDDSWKRTVRMDASPEPAQQADSTQQDSAHAAESWSDISPQSVNTQRMHLPVSGDMAGPSVLRVQVLLDRVDFSPGIIDGRWGKNTEKAVYWFQHRHGLSATGEVDEPTFQRLKELAGSPSDVVADQRLSSEDVSGPFVDIPSDIYEKAELDCMCYESLSEKLGELFHTSPDLLAQLNPDVDLNSLSADDRIAAPNVGSADPAAAPAIAQIVVSDGGHYVHAMDSTNNIVYHFPSTLGSAYSPSPSGRWEVRKITEDPWWHYQPDILDDVPDEEPSARIPPGPNNAVGKVWMDLTKPHYGIHGTSAPATIGYVTSHGCIRLTNWDALFLARRIEAGTLVRFVDGAGRTAEASL